MDPPVCVCVCVGVCVFVCLFGQSTQWGHVERSQFT